MKQSYLNSGKPHSSARLPKSQGSVRRKLSKRAKKRQVTMTMYNLLSLKNWPWTTVFLGALELPHRCLKGCVWLCVCVCVCARACACASAHTSVGTSMCLPQVAPVPAPLLPIDTEEGKKIKASYPYSSWTGGKGAAFKGHSV